jgi:radical SAM protein with 4Fe4S-binding SPASM domain
LTQIKAAIDPAGYGNCVNAANPWAERPFIVIWEVTRACALACRHCRAEAIHRRDPRELNAAQTQSFLDQVARVQPKVFVLTGGDPMMRPDLLEIIASATERDLHVSMSPSATPRFVKADLCRFRDVGLRRVSLSIDGATRESHDQFRGVRGTWDRTMESIGAAIEAGLEVQINTTFTRQNIGEFDAFVRLVEDINPSLWSVFQLVPTGRARPEDLLTGHQMEALFERLYAASQRVPFPIKTTEGQHYRRVALQQWKRRNSPAPLPTFLPVNDGSGFVFVSHTGDIQPSGFLPICAGNVREHDLLDVYRDSPVFRKLREPGLLKGKCRRCEFRSICGGSRARAYAMTGDYLAEEPLCVYQPPRLTSAA